MRKRDVTIQNNLTETETTIGFLSHFCYWRHFNWVSPGYAHGTAQKAVERNLRSRDKEIRTGAHATKNLKPKKRPLPLVEIRPIFSAGIKMKSKKKGLRRNWI